MRKKNRSFLLMVLLSASLLVSMFTIVQAQSPAAPAAKATKWSDSATWPNRKVPVAGDKISIEKDKQVVLDVTPPAPIRQNGRFKGRLTPPAIPAAGLALWSHPCVAVSSAQARSV